MRSRHLIGTGWEKKKALMEPEPAGESEDLPQVEGRRQGPVRKDDALQAHTRPRREGSLGWLVRASSASEASLSFVRSRLSFGEVGTPFAG